MKGVYRIDFNQWTRPATYAAELNIHKQQMNFWIKKDLIQWRKIEEVDLVLVKRGSERLVVTDASKKLPVELRRRSNESSKSKAITSDSISSE